MTSFDNSVSECGHLPERWRRQQPCMMSAGHEGEHSWERCGHCGEPYGTHPGGFGGALACLLGTTPEEGQALAQRVADRL